MFYFIFFYLNKILNNYINNNMSYIVNNINYNNIDIYNDEIVYESIINYYPNYDYDIIQNNIYYIGLCSNDENKFLVNSIIPITIFYMYNYDQILDYLLCYSCSINNWQRIEIFQINYDKYNNFIIYTAIIKTYYIRILQRKWRKYLKNRNKYFFSSKFIIDFKNRELCYNLKKLV